MDIWYKLTFLPSLIHELSQSLSSIFTEASKFSLKDWKKRHVYLLEIGLSLNLRMYQNFVTFLFNAEKKRKKTVLTTQAESLRNLIEDLSEILRNPLRTIESTFQDRLLSALLEDAIDKESSDKAQNASNFVCSFFSNIFEQYQLESGDPLPWGAFLKTLDSYKQNVETPLESTQLLELGWRLPEELAEGAPTYNNGWRAYDKNTTPVSNSRIIALSSLHIPPGSTIAYALRLDYRQTELLKRVLDVFGEELE
ncbi:MAG: hypothetical protein LVR00_02045 [Rhabdochlamydiaceae bacterium]|jgi:hypothetical protein